MPTIFSFGWWRSLLTIVVASSSAAWSADLAANPNRCTFGIEASFAPWDAGSLPAFLHASKKMGAEFVVFKCIPKGDSLAAVSVTTRCELEVQALDAACKQAGIGFVLNQEITNYSKEGTFVDAKGRDLLAHADGTHRLDLTGACLQGLKRLPAFCGVLYDEMEHGQLRRHMNTNGGSDDANTWRVHPVFAATDGMTVEQAYEAIVHGAQGVAQQYRGAGVIPMSEHVFPVLLHALARAGFDPGVKFMKEGIDPVFAAIGIGAARQYGRAFCAEPDLWGLSGFLPHPPAQQTTVFPGHPPQEFRASLLYAYWLGSSRIFVEDAGGLLSLREENGQASYEPTEHGKVFAWFATDYVPRHPRPHTFRDMRPEVAIVRLDDSCWGQRGTWLPDALLGAANLPTTPASAAWFGIWEVLTHGHTRAEGISFHQPAYRGQAHDFFCPLRGVVVYDHLVEGPMLAGLKLIWLTGVAISPRTRDAVQTWVRGGGLCVTPATLAPATLTNRSGLVVDGTGRWLVTDDVHSEVVRQAVAPFLGRPDEIRYRFGTRTLIVQRGVDGNDIRIFLQSDDGPTQEAARVW
ncbi:MAG: hypothetical protein RBU24_04865 [Kiritimatiellia bacterium]|jgi:hypothetical protein|nr:hypothetical protein [Kiritimatiellia bacterium]